MVLPDQPGPHPHLAVVAGKGGTIYLVDRDHMGHYQPGATAMRVQTVPGSGGVYGSMAYWNHNLYVLSNGRQRRAARFRSEGWKALAQDSQRELHSGYLRHSGGFREWLEGRCALGAALEGLELAGHAGDADAFDAENIAHQLYSSEQNATRDRAGLALRFNIPTVVNGRVYVGAKREVDVYGLLSAARAGK